MNQTARIARKNTRITFQKNAITSDEYKNRIQAWTDYFSCFAYASTYAEKESGEEVIHEERQVTFECRYCPELAVVTSTGYRILFNDEPYNIESVDPMNYQNKEIRFTCRRQKRGEASDVQ